MPGKDRGDHLRKADQNRDAPGDLAALGLTRRERFGADHPDAAEDQRPGDRCQRFGQLESEPRRDEAEHGGDRERDAKLQRVVAVARIAKAGRELPETLPVDQHDGEDRAGLDHDVEHIRAVAEPVLGDQQMAGARDRQEFGDAFDHAEQDQIEQLAHVRLRPRIRRKVARRIGENLRRQAGVPLSDICTVLVITEQVFAPYIVQLTNDDQVSIQVIDNDHVYVRITHGTSLAEAYCTTTSSKDMRWPPTTSSS